MADLEKDTPGVDLADAGERAAEVARSSYGRILALLAARFGDIIAAEDALADAFERALNAWPKNGIPSNPEAWLFTAARNRLIDAARYQTRHPHDDTDIDELFSPEVTETDSMPDERLKLMFVCAHPAIDANMHTPLMLQTVLGIEAELIARAFLVAPSTMAQRLVRAKRKIRDAAIPFRHPSAKEHSARLGAVLEAIYGAWSVDGFADGPVDSSTDLKSESLYLAVLTAQLMPHDAEALGLAALVSFAGARVNAARTDDGAFVPLADQNPRRWDTALIKQGRRLLLDAGTLQQPGRFQLEAAIQAVHSERSAGLTTNWKAVVQLYEGLFQIAPTIGAAVGRAAAVGEAYGPGAGLDALGQIEASAIETFQPAWVTRAALLARLGLGDESRRAYSQAIELTREGAVQDYLVRCLNELG